MDDVQRALDAFMAWLEEEAAHGFVRPGWYLRAACRGHGVDAFFAHRAEAARAVCAACPVQRECLAEAVALDVAGTWGGTTERERRALRSPRAA